MKWANEYKVHYYHTDYNNILKPGHIARYMQETAWNALKNLGPRPEYLKKNNIAFILVKISFRYYENIYEDDIIKAETWVNPRKPLFFPRNYRIYKKDKIAVEAVSDWVVLNITERAVMRPDILDKKFMEPDPDVLDFSVQKRINMPENMTFSYDYKIKYSDIDSYFHMNNAVYIDLICDNLYNKNEVLSPELKKHIISLDINYNSEAVFAQELEISEGIVYSGDTEEHYISAKIKNTEKNCFESKTVLTKR